MEVTGPNDAALPDSAMMDGTIDDLFGEAADDLAVSLPPLPLPAGLFLRIAEMQGLGCCTKLAWSNIGSVARISADGSKITFYAMVRDKKSRMWVLSGESKNPIVAPEGRSFIHIQFNGVGIDLAATDNLGAVHLYTLTGPLGKMHVSHGHTGQDAGVDNGLDQIVGMRWLPLFPAEFRVLYVDPANKVGDRWEASARPREQSSARIHHPAEGRHALVYITRSAKVTLLYQNDGHSWQSTSLDIHPVDSSEELISHAGLGEDGAGLLIVTYDLAARFRLFRLTIEWNASQHTRAPNITFTSVAPTLDISHLGERSVETELAHSAGLTQLQIIPALLPSMSQGVTTFPTIIAVFTHASPPTDNTQPPNYFSIIARWQAEPLTLTLHSAFSKLKFGADTTVAAANPTTILRKQADVVTSKVILSIRTQNFDTLVALGASDGSVEIRDRLTMESLETSYGDPTTVTTLPQSGFEHLSGDHNLHIAMSADASCLAFVRTDEKLLAHAMSLTYGWQLMEDGISDNKAFLEAAIVCVARQFALLLYHNITGDETLALVPADASEETRSLIVKMIFRMMTRSPDISMQEVQKQQMMVLREPFVPRILSAQLALGTDADGHRNYAAQFAFAFLNLRLVGTALAQTMGRPNVPAVEVFHSLRGLVKWSIDLMVYILDTLVNVGREIKAADGLSAQDAFQKLIAESGNPSLHLLLCSFSRALLRFQTLWVGKYLHMLQGAVPRARSATERAQLHEVVELANKLPFKLSQFEHMISELDTAVRDAYTRSGLSGDRRSDLEIALITDGSLPAELAEPLRALMDTLLPKLCEGTALDRLFFWQTAGLGLDRCVPVVGPHPVHYDVIRKIPLPAGVLRRRCRRCGAEMEDLTSEKLRESPGWLSHAQRHCVCTNYWLEA